jgi:gamma-glutamyltranspeptidase
MFGRGQVIHRRTDGSLEGASDHRADGCALEA